MLLAEAGFPEGFSGVKLHYPLGRGPSYDTIAELAAQYLTRIGVRVQLTVDDFNALYYPEEPHGVLCILQR